jgi:urate oxidase
MNRKTELHEELKSLFENKLKEDRDFKLSFDEQEVPFTLEVKYTGSNEVTQFKTYIKSFSWYGFLMCDFYTLPEDENFKDGFCQIIVDYTEEQLEYFISKLK